MKWNLSRCPMKFLRRGKQLEEFIQETTVNTSQSALSHPTADVPMVKPTLPARTSINLMILGNKFVIKQVKGVRKQFLILNGEPILAFVTKGKKFTECTSYTEVTAQVDCKVTNTLIKFPGNLKCLH